MKLYLMTYKVDLADQHGEYCWQSVQDYQKKVGTVQTILPWNTKRPKKWLYDFTAEGHYRIAADAPGELFYDFVTYNHPRIKSGYYIRIRDNDGVPICPPLPAAPVAEGNIPADPSLSASMQAVAWLKSSPGHTHAEAAMLFGISRVAVTQAVARDKARGE